MVMLAPRMGRCCESCTMPCTCPNTVASADGIGIRQSKAREYKSVRIQRGSMSQGVTASDEQTGQLWNCTGAAGFEVGLSECWRTALLAGTAESSAIAGFGLGECGWMDKRQRDGELYRWSRPGTVLRDGHPFGKAAAFFTDGGQAGIGRAGCSHAHHAVMPAMCATAGWQ